MKDNEKIILDACCGGRMFWFNKTHPNTLCVETKICYGADEAIKFVQQYL